MNREELARAYGPVWDTQDLLKEFRVVGFCMHYVVVERKSDGQKGSLDFQHAPRFYFLWQPHTG